MKNQSGPMLDAGLSALIADLDERGLLTRRWWWPSASSAAARSSGVSTSGNGNSDDGRDHWPYCYTAVHRRRRHQARLRLRQVGQDRLGPAREPGPPGELLATIYHTVGIDPDTIVYNHLNQPRELVKAEAVTKLFG